MTEAEFDAAVARKKLPLDAATKAEISVSWASWRR